MSSDRAWLPRTPGRQLAAILALGAAGAGLVLLATRQGWAHVVTVPPAPLPASHVTITGSGLMPQDSALAVAGLATLAAILASRRLLRRLAGLLLAVLGGVLAVSAFTVSAASAIAAASSSVSPATASAGSVTDGSSGAAVVPDVAGAAPHVTFTAAGWQALIAAGAVAMIVAGLLVAWRATQLAVMPGRYDSPAGRPAAGQARPAGSDSASMWEALSRGDDPTGDDPATAGSGADRYDSGVGTSHPRGGGFA